MTPISKYKRHFSFLLDIIICLGIILGFTYLGMHSDIFHMILARMAPISVYLVSLSLVVAAIVAYFSWNRDNYPTETKSSSSILSQRQIILLFLTGSICISLIPVFSLWSSPAYHMNNIGGSLPLFDAGHYYEGAEEILHIGVMDTVNQRRPFNTLFLAARLLAMNSNYYYALLLQAAIFGISAFLASYAVTRTHGKSAGFVMFAALLGLSSIFLPEVLTESMGIVLGSLSFVLLWVGVYKKREMVFLAGTFFITIALMVRSGPMLMLPFLLVFAGYLFRGSGRFNWRIAAIVGIVIACGLIFNQSLIWLFGDGTSLPVGNFAYVLYGLAVGGKGWTQVEIDFPGLTGTEAEISSFLYYRSFELILQDPFQFVITLFHKMMTEPLNFFVDSFQSLFSGTFNHPFIPNTFNFLFIALFYIAVILGFIHFIFSCRNHPVTYFFLGVIFSTWLAIPFFYQDAPYRALAALFPIISAGIAMGTVGWRRLPCERPSVSIYSFDHVKLSTLIGLGILVCAFITPFIGPDLTGVRMSGISEIQYPHHNETNNFMLEQTFVMRIDQNIPHIEVISDDSNLNSFSPLIRKRDLVIPEWIRQYYNITDFPDDPTYSVFLRGYDQVTNRTVLVIAPHDFIPKKREIITFRAYCSNCPDPALPGPLRIYTIT